MHSLCVRYSKRRFRPWGFPTSIHIWSGKRFVSGGLKNLTQYEYKALSQNLGHEHAMTTYNSYGALTEDEQLEAISNIGQANPDLQNVSTADILAEVSRRTGK